jgi:hypothetical protein
MLHSNAHLSIYEIRDMFTFIIKGDVLAFVMGDEMGDTSTFEIKESVSQAMCIFFTCIIRDVSY